MRDYFYSIIVCILSTSILTQIVSNTKRKKLIRMISGIFLAISIFRPLSQINWEFLWNIASQSHFSADSYIEEGKKTALSAQETIIKDACKAYILDEAKKMGAKITVEFSLNEDLLPVSAEINAEVDPSVQIQLQNILTEDLGIPKENQIWTWYQENNSS